METQTIAAIDIGSNSLKLAIVKAAASDSFTVTLQERERVRLGHETLKTHRLSSEAINLSAETIGRFRQIAEARKADVILAVATASVREAGNSDEFVREIERQTGVRVEVLSSLEEARLIGVAASQNICNNECSLLNIDIGGGSTELSLMQSGEPHKLFSMKLGAVGLTEKYIFSDPPRPNEINNLRREIAATVEKPSKKFSVEKWELATGTSGTILRLAAILSANGDKSGEKASEKSPIELKKLAALNEKLAKMTTEERSELPGISRQRAEVIVTGGQILEGVMRALKIETVQPSSFALREGVIIDYLNEIEAESLPPVPDVDDRRLRGVFAIGRRYGYEEKHALAIAALAETIFDALAPVEPLERHHRTLLSAAALLHEIGYHISHESHHKHTLYLIKHSELIGFSETEKLIIANVARYHKGSLPKEKHTDFTALSESDQQVALKLGAILRLADALDRDYDGQITDVQFKRSRRTIQLKLPKNFSSNFERETVETKKDLFELAFDCELKIV